MRQSAVISHGFWTRRFAQRPDAIGSTMFVKGVPFTIVGIAPPQFAGVARGTATDVWIPIQTASGSQAVGPIRPNRTTLSTTVRTGGSC